MFNQKSIKRTFFVTFLLVLAACGEVGPSTSFSSVGVSSEATSTSSTTSFNNSSSLSEESTSSSSSTPSSSEVPPEGLLFDYFCNFSPNWEQCNETSGTVKNLTQFGLETTYYRRYGVFEDKFSSGTTYITNLKKSTIRFESGGWYYQRDFLFKTWSGNVNRSDADAIERNFQILLDFDDLFDIIEEIYERKLQLSDFNPDWEVLESYETNLYISPEEAEAIGLEELKQNILISDITYYQRSVDYIDGSFRITNNTGKTIEYMTMEILYHNSNNQIIDSEFTNQGTLFNGASVTKSLINSIDGYSYSDIAYITVVITSVRVS